MLAAHEGDRLLQGYFNDIVELDMRERVGARSTLPLRQLVQSSTRPPARSRVVVTRSGEDRGKQLEWGTSLALRRRYRKVFYWRGRGGVDFVVLDENGPLPVQVS